MITTKLSFLISLLIITVYFSYGTFTVNEIFLDNSQLSINNAYLSLKLGFSFPSTSATGLEIDVTSLLGENGFLKAVPDATIDNCFITSYNDAILLTAPLNDPYVSSISCAVLVTISKILEYNTQLIYSFRLVGSSQYPNSTEFVVTFLDFLTNPYTGKPILLFPDLVVNDFLLYEQQPDNNGIFKGKLTSTLTMLSPLNMFTKNAKISLLFSISLSRNNLSNCEIHSETYDTSIFGIAHTLSPSDINLNGQAFPLTEMTVSNKYMIVCDVTTYTPISPDQTTFSTVYYFPIPISINNNNPINGKYMYANQYELPYALLSVSDLKYESQQYYEATIDIKDVNRRIYLHNIVDFKGIVQYTIDNSIYASLISLIPDKSSIQLDLSALEPQYQTGIIKIRINIITRRDQLLITPYLSSSIIENYVSKSIFDMKPVPGSGIVIPPITPTIANIPDLGLCLVINTNIAHYVYHMNFPDHITVRGLDTNGIYEGDNYSIRQARPYEMSFDPPINTNIGANYILTLKKQQTLVSFPALPVDMTANNISNRSNYIFLPIIIDLKSNQDINPAHMMHLSYRSPLVCPIEPFYSTLFNLVYHESVTVNAIPDIPQYDVKMNEHFTVITNLILNCDIRSLGISILIDSKEHFYVEQCEVEGKTYKYESGLEFNEQTHETTLSFTALTDLNPTCSPSRTHTLEISCTLLRSYNPLLLEKNKAEIIFTVQSNISTLETSLLVMIPISSENPHFNEFDMRMKSISVDYKTKRALLQFGVNLLNVTPTTHLKYYFIYTDNFKSKPLKCNYPIFMKVPNHIVIGPIIQTSASDLIINCELEISRKYVETVISLAYIVEQDHYLPLMSSSTSFDNIAKVASSHHAFNISPNTNINDDSVSTIFDHFTLFNKRN